MAKEDGTRRYRRYCGRWKRGGEREKEVRKKNGNERKEKTRQGRVKQKGDTERGKWDRRDKLKRSQRRKEEQSASQSL